MSARPRRHRWYLLLPILFALSSTHQRAQQPTFRSGVDVIVIDVNVVSRAHTPISDLKATDFSVTVDRKPRRVVSAAFLRYDVAASADRTPEVAQPAEPSVARPPARNVLIAIDNDSMEPGDGLVVRREAAKFLDRLSADDRIGIVTIPRLRSIVTMTRNRDEVKRQIAEVVTGTERYRGTFVIGLGEAFDIERGDASLDHKVKARNCCGSNAEWPCREVYKDCFVQVEMETRQVQIQAHLLGQRSLDALRDLAESLSTVEGPKTLLLISGGSPPPDLKSATLYHRIETALAAGQVNLYTLYLPQIRFGRAQSDFTPSATTGASHSPSALDDLDLEREGIENATSAGGGTFMEIIGGLDQYFNRVAAEMSGSYMLGIEVAPQDRDGRPHVVSVTVNRKDAEVRARRQYVIESETVARNHAATNGPTSDAVIVPRSANAARSISSTPADLHEILDRAAAYVDAYEKEFVAILAEERSDLTLSKWVVQSGKGIWVVERHQVMAGDYLLVKRGNEAGWDVFHDVFEVDGKAVRQRNDRLKQFFLDAPEAFQGSDGVEAIRDENARYNLGFVDRSRNVPVAPLMFLQASKRDGFVFMKSEAAGDAVPTVAIAFLERASPTFLQGKNGDAPADGTFWIERNQGRVVRTTTRWDVDGGRAEISVTYASSDDGRALLVPTEMRETYVAGTTRLDCVTKYTRFTRFDAGAAHEGQPAPPASPR